MTTVNRRSANNGRYRIIATATDGLIQAAMGTADFQKYVGLVVKLSKMAASNQECDMKSSDEALGKTSLESAYASHVGAYSTGPSVAQIQPNDVSVLLSRTAPRGSHSGRPTLKRLKPTTEMARRGLLKSSKPKAGLLSAKPKAASCAFCKGGHKKTSCPVILKINGRQCMTLERTEIEGLCKRLGSETQHKLHPIEKGVRERMEKSGILDGDAVIPHDALHVILLKVYTTRPTVASRHARGNGQSFESGDNIVEATFLSKCGIELENAPVFYTASTIRVWMTQNVTKTNNRFVFSNLGEPVKHAFLQYEYNE
jgi:hypothetical protein